MLKKSRIQIALWVILLGVNFGFASNVMPVNIAYLVTLTNVSFLALVFYGNYFVIFPRYFNLQNNKLFFMITFLFILIIALIQHRVDVALFSRYVLRPRPHADPRHLFVFFKGFFWLYLIDLISIVFLMQDRIKEQMAHAQKMKEEKLNTELKLLKAQINPHFIFNALNNIYSLTYIKSEKAPNSILQLSQMLRYVLEECSNDRVTLKSEIEYIENFISFQRMKSPNGQNIVFEYNDVDANKLIAPMLFIPFIENSFKYSKIEEDENAYVHIRMDSNQQNVNFEIRNSIPESVQIKPGAGMGIENVKQRLDIIYTGNYTLEISEENHEYCVNLGINLI